MPTPDESPRVTAQSAKPGVWVGWLLAILAMTFLFILMPFLFWHATWFGRPLNDAQLERSLSDREHPHEIQHALSQIADRILSPAPATRASAQRFYPQVVAIAQSGEPELRLTAAWVMGQDNSVEAFHRELLSLLTDGNPMVRRNAALALVRFGDASGLEEIRTMLKDYDVPARHVGTITQRMKPGEVINPGTLLGRIEASGRKDEVRSEVPGTIVRWLVPDGTTLTAGQSILRVQPSEQEKLEAFRALSLVGEKRDLPVIEKLAKDASLSPNTRQQAVRTAETIRARP